MWFSPFFCFFLGGGRGEWRRSEHAHASYAELSFRSPKFSPYVGREERRVQGLDYTLTRQLGDLPLQPQLSAAVIVSLNS